MIEKDLKKEQKIIDLAKELNQCKKDYLILEERHNGVMQINRLLEEGAETEPQLNKNVTATQQCDEESQIVEKIARDAAAPIPIKIVTSEEDETDDTEDKIENRVTKTEDFTASMKASKDYMTGHDRGRENKTKGRNSEVKDPEVIHTTKQCWNGAKCPRVDCYFLHPGEEQPRAYQLNQKFGLKSYSTPEKRGKITTSWNWMKEGLVVIMEGTEQKAPTRKITGIEKIQDK